LDQISELVRGKILFDFAVKLSELLPVINCLPDFVYSMDKLVCNKQFSRDEYDHHIDFISAQDIVYDKLKYIMEFSKFDIPDELFEEIVFEILGYEANNLKMLRIIREISGNRKIGKLFTRLDKEKELNKVSKIINKS